MIFFMIRNSIIAKTQITAALCLVLFNLTSCTEATPLPDFVANVSNTSRSEYNKQAVVSSNTWVDKLNLLRPKKFLPTLNFESKLNTPIVVMLDEDAKSSSFIFEAKTNGKKSTDLDYKIYGFQKFQKDTSGHLSGILMGDKPNNSTDYYTFTNGKLLKTFKKTDYKKGDLADVGAIFGTSLEGFVSKGADAKFVLRDPVTTGWNYQTFGYFKQDLNGDGKEELGFQSLGAITNTNDIPSQGLARYIGTMNGIFYDKKVGKKYMLYANIEIWISFDQNQAVFNVDSSFNGTQIKIYEISPTDGTLQVIYPELKKKAQGTIDNYFYTYYYKPFSPAQFYLFSTDKNTAKLDRNTAMFNYNFLQNLAENEVLSDGKITKVANKHLKNGKLKANLYGEKAAEIGGVFELHDEAQGIVYMGAFGAKRD